MVNQPFIGILPAAGRGTRLAPLRYPKELLPIAYERDGQSGAKARAVAEYSIESIAAAGVSKLLIMVAPWKMAIVDYIGDGRHLGVDAGYLYQEEARGLPHALDLASAWCEGHHTVFAMPDTIFEPRDALSSLRELYLRTGADLALAVFPAAEAHRLGPVVLSGQVVEEVLDKPENPPVRNTWGAAIWGSGFTALLRDSVARWADETRELVLGEIFERAVRIGMNVVGHEFPGGSFEDIGTRRGVLRCLDGSLGPVAAEPGQLVSVP